ncbi:MAG: 2-polyprenyl-3-methyl-5-hydroxy-6-metoxy-1,4-benzoquinol methylase [Vicingaceae bacterium]|jgi:2-polyprenyl-3-methyl-5-hydroxy-6-metoxy-1,4-benzoquinol methylase
MIKTVTTLWFVLAFFACGNTTYEKDKANEHMHKSSFEELVKKFEDPKRDQWQKPNLVLEKLGDVRGKKIADIGAGTGYFSRRLAQKGASVLALDVDERFLNYIDSLSQDSLDIVTRKVNFDSPMLDSAEVDAILIVDTYHHIETRYEYFRDVWRGMKAGGQLIIVDFKKKDTPHGPPTEMRIEGFEVMKELQKAGFVKVVIDVRSLDYQYIILAKKYEKAI